jgi:hypothetical protein
MLRPEKNIVWNTGVSKFANSEFRAW